MSHTVRLPKVTANDDQVEILRWLIAEGDVVTKGQDLVELGTSKATVVISSENEGYLHHLAKQGDWCAVGSAVGEILPRPATGKTVEPARTSATAPRLSKAAEKELAAAGQNSGVIEARGLVTRRTLEGTDRTDLRGLERGLKAPPQGLRSEAVSREKWAQIMSLEVGQAGHINSSLTIQLMAQPILERLNKDASASMLHSLILTALAKNVAKSPKLTSYFSQGRIHYYDQVNLGFAIHSEKPLKVVVLKAADQMGSEEIMKALTRLTAQHMKGQLAPGDLEGATFTVSSLLSENILQFQPLINHYQSLMIGIGGDRTLKDFPLTITATYDHRVLDGVEVAKFLNSVRLDIMG